MSGIIKIGKSKSVENFITKTSGKKPVFVCVIGNTETGKIPGISAAGANPEITDFTPAADVEYLHYKHCKCIDGVPVTPDGIPTPALITIASLDILNAPLMVVVGGVRILPQTPYIELGGKPGGNISEGKGHPNPETVFENAKIFGMNLAKSSEYLVIGESIAGGTTTALGVLVGLGYEAWGKVSSSLPDNPLDLKTKVVKSGLEKAQLTQEKEKNDVFNVIKHLGDPIQPACAGFAVGAASKVPVILAGGTQMAAVAAIIKEIEPKILKNIAIGTTKWIVNDKQSNIKELIEKIDPDIPILAANFNFGKMKYHGLKVYEQGIVKEGVGAGGISVACLLRNNGKVSIDDIQRRVQQEYEKIMPK